MSALWPKWSRVIMYENNRTKWSTLSMNTTPSFTPSPSYKTSPIILAASLYVESNFSHFSLSALIASSSYSSSSNRVSLYNSLTRRFWTTSFEWFTSKCMTALGTWSAIVSRTMLKYEDISRRMSSVSRASRSVKAGASLPLCSHGWCVC